MPSLPSIRRSPLAAVLGSLVLVVTLLALAPASAAAPTQTGGGEEAGQSFTGTLQADGEPVEGVAIIVTDPAGAVVDEVETDAEGTWVVPVAERANGDYTIAIDPATLPAGVTLANPASTTRTIDLRPGVTQTLGFPLRGAGPSPGDGGDGEGDGAARPAPAREGPSLVDRLGERGVNGIKQGLIIAMAAIGLSLIFGTTGLINFAHGELVTFGAVAAWFLSAEGPEWSVIAAGAAALLIGAAVGGGLEAGLWRPLRDRKVGLFQMLVISIGLSLAARPALLIWFGESSRPYPEYLIQERLELGPLSATPRDLTVMVLSVVALVGVALLLQRTRVGKAMRAVSDNIDLAESSGIDVRRVILTVWIVGAGLAALGGVFYGVVETVNFDLGFRLLLLMFAAVILGGLGNAYGAMVGGLVIGLVTEISTIWLDTELKYVWALLVLIVVLLFKPTGILGIRERIG